MSHALMLLFVMLFGMQTASCASQIESKISTNIQNGDYKAVGQLLKQSLGKKIDWQKIKEISLKTGSDPLINAMQATSHILKKCPVKLKCADLLQTALFIETSLPNHVANSRYYFPKSRASHAYAVEYDPKTALIYIVLQDKNSFIGKGKKKVVSKAILYSRTEPRIVARAEQFLPMERELKMTKLLSGLPGICDFLGITKHKRRGKTCHTIYSTLYYPGALRTGFNERFKLSFYEKSKVALDILKGLESLHSRGIVHRDLGARNYFINIPGGAKGTRDVTACIADLGRTTYAADLEKGDAVQGSPSYCAPEGLNARKLKNNDYFQTDVFAVGCVFYELVYGKTVPWHDKPYFRGTKSSLKKRHSRYLHCLKVATATKQKHLKNTPELSPKQRFERMVLSMLDKDPKGRPTAAALLEEMQQIHQEAAAS
jgi:serine/threonine protein kinase